MKKLFEFLTSKLKFGSDLKTAKKLFQDNGLAFPTIPEKLASKLKEQEEWIFSTRKITMLPYNLQGYANKNQVEDYVLLSHSGHGINSYAIQYYPVHGNLKMFLHLGWGGVYMDKPRADAQIQTCFALADKIVLAVQTSEKLQEGSELKIVCSDFYGSYWSAPEIEAQKENASSRKPQDVLTEVLHWLQK